MAGFEPTTSRPPAERATGLRHIPNENAKITFDHYAEVPRNIAEEIIAKNKSNLK